MNIPRRSTLFTGGAALLFLGMVLLYVLSDTSRFIWSRNNTANGADQPAVILHHDHSTTTKPPQPNIAAVPIEPQCVALDKQFIHANPACERDIGSTSRFPSPPPPQTSSADWELTSVHYLEDTDWGFTCNKMEILSGAVFQILSQPRDAQTSALALGPIMSNLAKNLDFAYLAQDFPVLLDCNHCPDVNKVRCESIITSQRGGKLETDSREYLVHKVHIASDMYWLFGPSELKFSVVLATYLVPSLEIRSSMERLMQSARRSSKNKDILGVHRRDIDGYCYEYLGGGGGEYECALDNDALRADIEALAGEGTRELFAQKRMGKLKALERKHPMLMSCDYSLNAEQVEILSRAWPEVFQDTRRKFTVMWTTDGNNKAGDAKLLRSAVIADHFKIEQINEHDALCTNEQHELRAHRLMLKEMYALALADYHMANPCSSCDVIVVHWRKVLGQAIGSSFPPKCYAGQYASDKLETWKWDMAFFGRRRRATAAPTASPTTAEVVISTADADVVITMLRSDGKDAECEALRETHENEDCELDLGPVDESAYPFDDATPGRKHIKLDRVHALMDTDWGFTCNKMEILSGALYQVASERKSSASALALGPWHTNLVKNLDFAYISRDFPILLDCNICTTTSVVNCASILVFGQRIHGRFLLPIYKVQNDGDMYWYYGPSQLVFSAPLALYLLPSRAIRRSVEQIIRTASNNSSDGILGVHRRDIDGFCYEYLGSGTQEYECAFNAELDEQIARLQRVPTKDLRATEAFATLKALEHEHPMLMTCNYTMDQEQLGIFQRAWPEVFQNPRRKFTVLFTTDSNDLIGDAKLLQSAAIAEHFKIEHINAHDALCTNERHEARPHRLMLKEMYALALTKYHMANPCSSCDVIVVHWRKILGHAGNSSFPTACFNGHYAADGKLRAWRKKPFFKS